MTRLAKAIRRISLAAGKDSPAEWVEALLAAEETLDAALAKREGKDGT